MKNNVIVLSLALLIAVSAITGCRQIEAAPIEPESQPPHSSDQIPAQDTQTLPTSQQSRQEQSVDFITIEGVQYSTSLTELDLSNIVLKDETIAPLRYMTNLRLLNLSFGPDWVVDDDDLWVQQITDITPLAGLTSLEVLDLSGNQLSDITPLSGLVNLEVLFLSINQISDLTPLSGLTRLTDLSLGRNSIEDISPLGGLVNLVSLSLERNQINDITPLGGLSALRRLDLASNPIADWSPVANVEHVAGRQQAGNSSQESGTVNTALTSEVWMSRLISQTALNVNG